ncbi:MAG: lysophospholipid acyltransferase family protein [Desulfobacterales bacterium]|nr:lysophospholipid acyltransferase family protein [Desulfobacterales bacterium]
MKIRRKKRGWKRVAWELRYWLASVALENFASSLRFIPFTWTFSFIEGIGGKLAWSLAGKYKKKMLDNLTATFHDSVTDDEKRRIARESFLTMLRGFMETLYSLHLYRKRFYPRTALVGRENLEQALTLGKGVIGVSAHLGTFTLLGAKINASGFPLTWIMGGQPHPRLARVWREMGERVGTSFIMSDSSFTFHRQILRCLRKGEIVGFICDENQKQGGVVVEFLGRAMALPVGPAVYHLKTGAPILPMFILRQEGGGDKVIIDPPLEVRLSGDEERDIFTIVDQIARVMESYIKRYPGQWSWISKRRVRTRTRRKTFLEGRANPLS